jgi:hypothetical protein
MTGIPSQVVDTVEILPKFPKNESPKSHAHSARGWWRQTHIYRGYEVEGERLKKRIRRLSDAINMMSGPDEFSHGSVIWT